LTVLKYAESNHSMTNVPDDLRYAASHEWVRMEGELALVGITDHAQQELTDIVFVELPAIGRQLRAGEACAVVESVKTASDIYAPLAGEVVEVNAALAANPALVNSAPYGEGWFFKIRPSQPADLNRLLTADQYRDQIG
jgi:glycine cleavage system H protein